MKKYPKINTCALFVCCIYLLSILSARASWPPRPGDSPEWVLIPVVVNIIDASDANNVDAAIRKANEILEPAHIYLLITKINWNVNAGDGNGNLTEAEGKKAQEDGQEELDKTFGAGEGIKITVADDCWTEAPNNVGWSVHRNPVVVVEPGADANDMGYTIAHELGHALTIDGNTPGRDPNGHSSDPNDLMDPNLGGGTRLDPNDVNEIFPEAKKRGTAYFIVPRVLSGRAVAIPAGIDYSIDAHGAILDGFYDGFSQDPGFDPCDPQFGYADLREISFFCDDPFDPCSNCILEIQSGGPRPDSVPVDSLFWVSLYSRFWDHLGTVLLKIGPNVGQRAVWQDPISGLEIDLPPPIIHENQKFDGPTTIISNHSVEATIPIGLIPSSLGSAEPIFIDVSSCNTEQRQEGEVQICDYSQPYECGLTIPTSCPSITFLSAVRDTDWYDFGVTGCGFNQGGVCIELDGEPLGCATAGWDRTFTWFMDPSLPLEPGLHSVIAKERDDSGPTGAAYAIGYFNYKPCGEIPSDLDEDGDVDLQDLAVLGQHWLESCP